MAQGTWCYRACPYGRPGNAVYCGTEDANGNCPSTCDCPEKGDVRGGDFSGSLPKPPTTGGFRRADGMLKGKQEIFGLEVPKVLVIAGVAVAAYFIMKKVK